MPVSVCAYAYAYASARLCVCVCARARARDLWSELLDDNSHTNTHKLMCAHAHHTLHGHLVMMYTTPQDTNPTIIETTSFGDRETVRTSGIGRID